MKDKRIQQCTVYGKKPMKFPCLAAVKMNGIFGRYDHEKNKFFTRQDNVILGMSHLEKQMKPSPIDFDGELVIPGMDFFELNGKIRKDEETPDCIFYVFDGVSHGHAQIRFSDYIGMLTKVGTHIHPLKWHYIKDEKAADSFYQKVCDKGFEGVVYKDPDQEYYDGKKVHIQKRVPEKTTEGVIIGFEEGKKSFTGMLGAFLVELPNGNCVKVGIGQGMTHEFRKEVWNNQGKYLNKVMKMAFKTYTVKGSLQSPKFVCIRWDIPGCN